MERGTWLVESRGNTTRNILSTAQAPAGQEPLAAPFQLGDSARVQGQSLPQTNLNRTESVSKGKTGQGFVAGRCSGRAARAGVAGPRAETAGPSGITRPGGRGLASLLGFPYALEV